MTDRTRDAAERRVAELKEQYREGEVRLVELTRQEAALRETMLRISGAVQVLEELLDVPAPAEAPATPAAGHGTNGASPETVLTVS